MNVSDALFHLVCMQEKANRDGEMYREKAAQKNAGKSDRARWSHVAAHHAEEAAALEVAIRALMGQP